LRSAEAHSREPLSQRAELRHGWSDREIRGGCYRPREHNDHLQKNVRWDSFFFRRLREVLATYLDALTVWNPTLFKIIIQLRNISPKKDIGATATVRHNSKGAILMKH
jgi:hypothetical protein